MESCPLYGGTFALSYLVSNRSPGPVQSRHPHACARPTPCACAMLTPMLQNSTPTFGTHGFGPTPPLHVHEYGTIVLWNFSHFCSRFCVKIGSVFAGSRKAFLGSRRTNGEFGRSRPKTAQTPIEQGRTQQKNQNWPHQRDCPQSGNSIFRRPLVLPRHPCTDRYKTRHARTQLSERWWQRLQ